MADSFDPDRLRFLAEEILATTEGLEPLVANGVRCHGGFDSEGRYRSPRTLHRADAIRAWQGRIGREGGELLSISRELIPPQFPNVAQAKLLLQSGVRDPIVRALTTISIVEGFGAIIRDVPLPDLRELVKEPIEDTALAHLGEGLFEAHARDEAGHRDEGGHKQMWEAARDLALERPKIPGDVLMRIMGRRQAAPKRKRAFPQLDEKLENLVSTMVNVLVVEVFAENVFSWGLELLSDPEVSAEPERAGAMVGYIRSDENPHVEYLRTALSELRSRTVATVDGGTLAGRALVDGMLHRTLRVFTHDRPREQRDETRASLLSALDEAGSPGDLREQFDALESPVDRHLPAPASSLRPKGREARHPRAPRRTHRAHRRHALGPLRDPEVRAAAPGAAGARGSQRAPTSARRARCWPPPSTCAASSSRSARWRRPARTCSRRPSSRSSSSATTPCRRSPSRWCAAWWSGSSASHWMPCSRSSSRGPWPRRRWRRCTGRGCATAARWP